MDMITPPTAVSNAPNIDAAMSVLVDLIRARLKGEEIAPDGSLSLGFFDDGSFFGNFIKDRKPPYDAFITLLLALAPHVRPAILDTEIRQAMARDGDFPEIGGERDEKSRTFFPTGQTAAFLLGGDDLETRFAVQRLFNPNHWFANEQILSLEPAEPNAPILSGRLTMSRDWVERLTLGEAQAPTFNSRFPARLITTGLDWKDLILAPTVRAQIQELEDWVQHGQTLMDDWGMAGRLKPGYRALFYGPPGTGKTLTATLLGKATDRPVYRVDLATVVSKYIGETEKNLAALFDRATNQNWVLFFDEADSIFGKRTSVKTANDRYANQGVSYLLQRVEDFAGLVILSSNLRGNIDDAFMRRFNAIISFPMPGRSERAEIWRRSLPKRGAYKDLAEQLSEYELSGGNIVNVVHHAAIAAISRNADEISIKDAMSGIRREMEKEGRVFK